MTQKTCTPVGNYQDTDYADFLARINTRFLENCANNTQPLFTTSAENLWEIYLNSFSDPVERQFHNCHACKHFIERFGGLVTIDSNGTIAPAIWNEDDAPAEYKPTIALLAKVVRRAKVTGVFLSKASVWGVPKTGVWTHFAVFPTKVFTHSIQTSSEAMAEKREDFKTIMRALNDFTKSQLEIAVTLLKTDSLYRSEKVLGQAEWLYALHTAYMAAHSTKKANIVWRAVSTAPAGFCHPRSSMIGTLLEDIAEGKSYNDVSRAFAAKMNPLHYQRPQAAPALEAIDTAEKLIQRLGLARSLPRRFARLDEVKALWKPADKTNNTPDNSIFGHLKAKVEQKSSMKIPPVSITWDKFKQTILPNAKRIEFLVPHVDNYTALVTAVNIDAPPILQWDSENQRNPVSWYYWLGGASAESFGLKPNEFVNVEAITLIPSEWNESYAHFNKDVIFILTSARESRQAGAALFPEMLKAELHGIRSVIEAYSKNASIEGMNEPHAAGVGLSSNQCNAIVKVWVDEMAVKYKIDRWD